MHAAILCAQLYLQQLQRMLGPDAMSGIELDTSNRFIVELGNQLATSAAPSLFGSEYFAPKPTVESIQSSPAQPPLTARRFDSKPIAARPRLTQPFVNWQALDGAASLPPFNHDDQAVGGEPAWFAGGACTGNTVALVRTKKETELLWELPAFNQGRFAPTSKDGSPRLKRVQVIDRSCLEQVLRDARQRDAERITARGNQPVKARRQPRGLLAALKNTLSQLAELL
jgi:hypothetical protein